MLRNHHYIRSSHLSERVGAQKTLFDTNISHLEKDINVLWEQMIENLLIRVIITLCYFFYFSPFLLLLTEQANLFDIFYFSCILISNKIFEPAWATDQWVKIFSILVKISSSFSNFSVQKLPPRPRSIILQGVQKISTRTLKKKWQMWPLISMYVCTFICVTLSPLKACVKVLRNGWGHDWLPAVWYCGETELSQSKKNSDN